MWNVNISYGLISWYVDIKGSFVLGVQSNIGLSLVALKNPKRKFPRKSLRGNQFSFVLRIRFDACTFRAFARLLFEFKEPYVLESDVGRDGSRKFTFGMVAYSSSNNIRFPGDVCVEVRRIKLLLPTDSVR